MLRQVLSACDSFRRGRWTEGRQRCTRTAWESGPHGRQRYLWGPGLCQGRGGRPAPSRSSGGLPGPSPAWVSGAAGLAGCRVQRGSLSGRLGGRGAWAGGRADSCRPRLRTGVVRDSVCVVWVCKQLQACKGERQARRAGTRGSPLAAEVPSRSCGPQVSAGPRRGGRAYRAGRPIGHGHREAFRACSYQLRGRPPLLPRHDRRGEEVRVAPLREDACTLRAPPTRRRAVRPCPVFKIPITTQSKATEHVFLKQCVDFKCFWSVISTSLRRMHRAGFDSCDPRGPLSPLRPRASVTVLYT